MPPASPVPPLPADCRVETLARMLRSLDNDEASYESMAHAVRALVEHEVGAMAESWKQAVLDQVLLARDGDGLTDDHPANEPLFKVLESMGFDHLGDPIGGAS